MTEHTDKVERQRLLQQAEKWAKEIRYIHANGGVVETKFNNDDIQYKETLTGKVTWKRKGVTKKTLIDKFLRR